jgi:hypothetical protein
MKALNITVGRTAIKALLIAAVLTAGIVSGVGTAAAEPLDGKGNDVPTLPPSLYSLDGVGNDATINAFPINNVTVFAATYVGRGGGSGKPSF